MKLVLSDHFKIETKRLVLRPFNLGDLDDFATICADAAVMRYIGDGQALDRESSEQLLNWIIAQYEICGFGLLATVLKENNNLLGFCGLIQQKIDEESHIELGYRLDRAFWSKGIATEAAFAIGNYACSQLKISHLVSIIQIDNIASKRVAQKIGMQHWKQTLFKERLVDIFYKELSLDSNE